MNTQLLRRFLRYEIYAAGRCFQLLSERRDEANWAEDVIAFGDAAVAYLPSRRSRNKPRLWMSLDNASRLAWFYEKFHGVPTNLGVTRLSAEEAAARAAAAAAKPSNVKQLRSVKP